MTNNTYKYLLSDIKNLKGVGLKTSNLLRRKKINKIFDLLWRLPKTYTDRTKSTKIKKSIDTNDSSEKNEIKDKKEIKIKSSENENKNEEKTGWWS